MMFMTGAFYLFASLGIGYATLVLAAKQKDVLKSVGLTIGASIIVLSLVYGLLSSMLDETKNALTRSARSRGSCKMMKQCYPYGMMR